MSLEVFYTIALSIIMIGVIVGVYKLHMIQLEIEHIEDRTDDRYGNHMLTRKEYRRFLRRKNKR